MSEPKTVMDAYSELCDGDDRRRTPRRVSQDFLKKYGDYHIIPGADAVVTPQGLEDAAEDVKVTVRGLFGGTMADRECLAIARAALEAAGIEVVDKVVEVSNDDGRPCPHDIIFWVPGDEEYSFIDLHVGDRVFVKRGEE